MHNHRRYQSISCNIKEATKWRKVRWTKANTIIKSAFLLLWPLILTPGMPSRSLARFSDIPHWTLSRRCGFLSDKKTDLELFLFLFLSQVHLKRTSLQRNKCLLDVKVRQLVTEVLKYGTLFGFLFFFKSFCSPASSIGIGWVCVVTFLICFVKLKFPCFEGEKFSIDTEIKDSLAA